jgi:hypothetical protein
VVVDSRVLRTTDGQLVGRLSNRADIGSRIERAEVSGILVRTREQTPPDFLTSLRTDRWETVLVEAVVGGDSAAQVKPS